MCVGVKQIRVVLVFFCSIDFYSYELAFIYYI